MGLAWKAKSPHLIPLRKSAWLTTECSQMTSRLLTRSLHVPLVKRERNSLPSLEKKHQNTHGCLGLSSTANTTPSSVAMLCTTSLELCVNISFLMCQNANKDGKLLLFFFFLKNKT